MSPHDVLVSIDPPFDRRVTTDWLVGIARIALETECVGACQLGIVLTDDEQVRALNRQYAGDDRPTDVLSFALQEGEMFVSPDNLSRFGEVIISYETAARQAHAAGYDTNAELAHLLVHGVLHLLGYDHQKDDEGQAMRERERLILGEAGLQVH